MNKILYCGIFAAFCFFCSTASAATFGYSVQRCKEVMQARPPQVDVVYSYGSLRLDNSKDADGIKAVFEQVYPNKKSHKINGLTLLSPHAVVENSITTELIGERLCYYPQRIILNIGYRPIVYISKDLTSNPCRFNLTVRHEQTHLDIGHLSLQLFARQLKREFPQIVENIGPIVKSRNDKVLAVDEVAKELNQSYHEQLKVLFDEFVQKLLDENARIDSEENYEEERHLCPDI